MSEKIRRVYKGLCALLGVLYCLSPAQAFPQQGGHPGTAFTLPPDQRAEWLLARKRYPEALAAYKAMLEGGEADSAVFRGLIRAYRGASGEAEAETYLTEYLAAHPESSAAHYGLGYHHYLKGNDDQARIHLEKATRQDPQNALAWNNLGASLARTKSYTYAIKSVKEAIRLEPENPMFYNNLGEIYREKGNYGLFFAEFRAHVKDGQSLLARGYGRSIGRALRQEGFKLYAQGKLEEAIGKFDEMAGVFREIGYTQGLVPAYFSLGLLYEEKGEGEKAASYFREVLKINPNHIQAREKIK